MTNGANGQPQGGATVGGVSTGADGNAQLTYAEAGIYRLKANRPTLSAPTDDRVRRSTGADPCTSTDKTGPSVNVQRRGDLASERGRSRTVLVEWLGDDGASGSGVTGYKLEASDVQWFRGRLTERVSRPSSSARP